MAMRTLLATALLIGGSSDQPLWEQYIERARPSVLVQSSRIPPVLQSQRSFETNYQT